MRMAQYDRHLTLDCFGPCWLNKFDAAVVVVDGALEFAFAAILKIYPAGAAAAMDDDECTAA